MFLAAFLVALLTPPLQQTAGWGDEEWRNGVGMMSGHYFRTGTGFPSGYELENGTRAGSFYHLIFGTAPGSAYFWRNGTGLGSAYFWRNGVEQGSRYYWLNGEACLSQKGWREGAICDGREILTFQTLCIAEAIDVAPCREINIRLESWLDRSRGLSTGDMPASIAEMRATVD